MDELIGRFAAEVGVDRAAAEKAVGFLLKTLHADGSSEKIQSAIDRVMCARPAHTRIDDIEWRGPRRHGRRARECEKAALGARNLPGSILGEVIGTTQEKGRLRVVEPLPAWQVSVC